MALQYRPVVKLVSRLDVDVQFTLKYKESFTSLNDLTSFVDDLQKDFKDTKYDVQLTKILTTNT